MNEVQQNHSQSQTWDFFHVLRTEMHKACAPIFHELGLTEIQVAVLVEIDAGCSCCAVGELAERLNSNQGNFSALCKKLEHMELLVRSRSKEDERVVTPQLTEAGKAKVKAIHSKLDEMFRNNASEEQIQTIMAGYNEAVAVLKKINSQRGKS